MTTPIDTRRDAVSRALTDIERAQLANEPNPRSTLVGLAFSGGGIRSATFALGVMQALGERGLLWMFDYLSTVSGGGYVGGWWSAWLSRRDVELDRTLFPADERLEPDRFPASMLDENNAPERAPDNLPAGTPDGSRSAWLRDPIHHLRLFSNYLTPRKGALSADTWRAATIISRNLMLTWLVLLPLLLAAVVATQLYFAGSETTAYGFACSRPDSVIVDSVAKTRTSRARVDTTEPCVRAAMLDNARRVREHRPTAPQLHAAVLRDRLDVVTDPLFAAALMLGALTILWMLYGAGQVPPTLAGFIGLAGLVWLVVPKEGSTSGDAHGWSHFLDSPWFPIGVAAAIGILVIGGLWTPVRTAFSNARDEANAMLQGLPTPTFERQRVARDRVRNTVVRWHAHLLVVTVIGAVVLTLAGFAHELTWYLFDSQAGVVIDAARKAGGWIALAISVGSGLFTVLRAGPSAQGKDAAVEKPSTLATIVIGLAPPLVLFTLLIAMSTLGRSLYAQTAVWPKRGAMMPSWTPVAVAALVGSAMLAFYALYERWTLAHRGDGQETVVRRYVLTLAAPVLVGGFTYALGAFGLSYVSLPAAVPVSAVTFVGALLVVRTFTVKPNGTWREWTTRAFRASGDALRLDSDVLSSMPPYERARAAYDAAVEADAGAKRSLEATRALPSSPATQLSLGLAQNRAQVTASDLDAATRALQPLADAYSKAVNDRTAARRRALVWFLSAIVIGTLLALGVAWRVLGNVHVPEAMVPSDDVFATFAAAGLAFGVVYLVIDLGLSRRECDRAVWLTALAVLGCGALLATRYMPRDRASTAFVIAGVGLASFLVAWVVGLGWTADPNLLALHNFYKARLVRAYLGASNHEERRATQITETARHDDIPLKDLRNHELGAPVHIINTTLNLVGGRDLATAQRYAAPFTMSSEICGSARTGYHWTADYMDGALTLGTAVATSGAAVSTNMGSKSTSSALALLLALFNVRLGLWAPTPNQRRWFERQPRLWPFYLLREALSQTNDLGAYCYLTDGGHFDNTGIYSLVERGCRCIVMLDDGADIAPCFSDVGEAIRRCRIDFGAEIRLADGVTKFGKTGKSKSGLAPVHIVRGTIKYAATHLRMLGWTDAEIDTGSEGTIIWIKPVVTRDDPVDVRQYKLENSAFPQQSTTDQWYDESQFESYRALGYHSIAEAIDRVPNRVQPPQVGDTWMDTFVGIRDFFEDVARPVP